MATARVRRLDSNWDMTLGKGALNYASGAEATQQRVRANLLGLLGEWFLDTTFGVPWFAPGPDGSPPIMGVPRNLQYAEAQIKKTILGTDGVQAITNFFMNFNTQTRALTVSVSGTTVDGNAFQVAAITPGQ